MFCHRSTLSDHSPFWKSSHIWRYKYLLSRKSLHKDTSISVIFWTFLLEKLTNRETHHLIRAFVSSSGNNCGNISRYMYHLNKSLQGFLQRKLDKFEIKLTLCHHMLLWYIAIFLLFGVLTVMNISEMHAKLVVSYYSFIYRK